MLKKDYLVLFPQLLTILIFRIMKKYFIISVIVYSLLITLFSCQPKPLKVNLDQAETKLVISSQVIPNSVMIVAVSKSFAALEDTGENDTTGNSNELLNQILVGNAKVTITYNGIETPLFPIPNTKGFYASVTVPQKLNVEYKLKVYDPETGLQVTSTETMLKKIPFDSVSAKRQYESDSNNVKYEYSFTDPADEINFYMVNLYATSSDTSQSNNPFEKNTADQVTILLSDVAFNGKQFEGSKILYNWTSDTIVTSISNISEGYFNYLSARKRGGNLFSSLVGEPINYPTNIVGGYGFFTTHFPDARIIYLK